MFKTIKIEISEDLEDRLKVKAADKNISLEEFIVEGLSKQTQSSLII
jgi:predicted HicB family RNase H-like nuclease